MDTVWFQSNEIKKVSAYQYFWQPQHPVFLELDQYWPLYLLLGDLSLRMFWQCPKSKLLEYFLIPLCCIRPSLATTMTFMAIIGFMRFLHQCDGSETSRGFFLSGMKCVLMGQMLRLCKINQSIREYDLDLLNVESIIMRWLFCELVLYK